MTPWRRKIERWIGQDRQDSNIRQLNYWLSILEGRVDNMSEVMEALKAEVAKLKDAVVAVGSAVVQLRKAYEQLRDHPKVVDDPELGAVVADIGDATGKLTETVAVAGASGGA